MQISLDKKSNIEYLEKEFGLHKFLPKSVLDAIKPKVLKKAIQQQFKKVKFSVYFLILTDKLENHHEVWYTHCNFKFAIELLFTTPSVGLVVRNSDCKSDD